ncbi:UPF0149 family protein [Vibrio sp. SCSIO 43136]|uniref:UPF0149 family protein n=1 Tax=Vibrio sp. SCSIO 43136 TaxID=2819101 RepID=UPI0020757B4F|nr:UPF0149 family protein [Vibrio sp. SCSIO 43136]USD64314.1 UPF0149 family protein [Vibrio sp. SCSIO 43136]
MTLQELLNHPDLEGKLLTEGQIRGFVTAMAAAPNLLMPQEWLAFLWGGDEQAPFTDGAQLEQFAEYVIEIWNQARPALLEGSWQWPQGCALDEEEVVNTFAREFSEGLLQGWTLARDDWETLMPEDSEDNALLGGVLLSISMLYDPETAMATLAEQGIEGLEQFEEIFNAIPMMLCGLTQRGAMLVDDE